MFLHFPVRYGELVLYSRYSLTSKSPAPFQSVYILTIWSKLQRQDVFHIKAAESAQNLGDFRRGDYVDPMQPTVIYDSSASMSGQDSLDVSRANVGFVAGERPYFSDETAALVRSRLSAASLVIAVVLGAAFVGNLVSGITNLWWFRGLILLIIAGSVLLSRF